jgi:hypothetical protein
VEPDGDDEQQGGDNDEGKERDAEIEESLEKVFIHNVTQLLCLQTLTERTFISLRLVTPVAEIFAYSVLKR